MPLPRATEASPGKGDVKTNETWLITARGGKLVGVSKSLPHNDDVGPSPHLLRILKTLAEAIGRRTSVIISLSDNWRHTVWGFSDINAKGESHFDFKYSDYPFISNRSTFVTTDRKEDLNLTLASRIIEPLISE